MLPYSPYSPYPPYAPVVLPPSPAELERRALRREGHFLGTGMLLLIFLQQIIASVVLLLLSLFGVIDPSAITDDRYWGLDHTVFLFVYMAIYAVMMGVPMWFSALCFRVKRNPFGMHRRVRPATFAAAVTVGMGGCILSNLLTGTWVNIWSLFGINMPETELYTEKGIASLLLNLLIFAVLPALLEEMVFRGFVLIGLRPLGDGAAIVLSALLFGLMHTNLLQLPFAFLLGLMMGWLVIRTGNIWVSVTIHFLNNGMATALEWASLYMSEEAANQLTVAVFAGLAILGVAVLGVLLFCRSVLTVPPKPLLTALPADKRRAALLGSPCMWIALILFSVLTVLSSVLTSA